MIVVVFAAGIAAGAVDSEGGASPQSERYPRGGETGEGEQEQG